MRRAAFLRASGGAMAVAALAPLATRALASDVVDYTLTAAPLRFTPAPGAAFAGTAFNGTIPGPVLRLTHGQQLRAKFVNLSGAPATIHWHGMILPNKMDGVEGVTQAAVPHGGSFEYAFAPDPSGTRWYHDHISGGLANGLFGLIIVEDPKDEPADKDFALVFHDVPKPGTMQSAMMGVSNAPMTDPIGSPEMQQMRPSDKMGDEVGYVAHCINGASYPAGKSLSVKTGDRVRFRILNANPTQTRYVRLAGHRLTVTHLDGNRVAQPLTVDALRVGAGERFDAYAEITKPGAYLLQGLSSDPLAYQQAVVLHTEGMENATPLSSPQSLEGVDYFTYEKAAGLSAAAPEHARFHYTIGGGKYGSSAWTLNGKVYPHTERMRVHRGEMVSIHFLNQTDMDHPLHLHGHVPKLVEVDGKSLARPLAKDTTLIRANGGTVTWRFAADSPPGRWLLHCHNEIHMMDGMMTELVYV